MPPAPMRAIWIVSFGEYIADPLSLYLHRIRVPLNHAFLTVADIRKQSRPSCPEAEERVRNDGLARPDRKRKVQMMILMIAVVGRRLKGLLVAGLQRRGGGPS